MGNSAASATWVPSDDLRARLTDEGWIQIDDVISLDALRAAEGWISANAKDPRRLLLLQTERDPSGELRKFRRMYWADPEFWARWIVASGLRQVVRFVIGPSACLMKQAAFLKARAGGSGVGYHQDQGLWETTIPGAYSFWMPLDPADATNGGLIMFTGSHRQGIFDHVHRDDHPWHGVVDVDGNGLQGDQVVIRPGGMVVHNPYLVHGSEPNVSDQRRYAVVFTFAPEPAEETRPHLKEDYVSLSAIEALAESAEGAGAKGTVSA